MLQTTITGVKLHSISSSLPENSVIVEGKRVYKTTFHQTTADLGFDAAKRLLDSTTFYLVCVRIRMTKRASIPGVF